jgi:hypothetical protein
MTNATPKPEPDEHERQRTAAIAIMNRATARFHREKVAPSVALPIMLEMAISGLLKLDVIQSKMEGTPLTFNRAQLVANTIFHEYVTLYTEQYSRPHGEPGADHPVS